MASLLDHQQELLEACGLSTDGLNSSEIAERARVVLAAADRYRLRAEAPVLDEHVSDEFKLKDAEATTGTMAAEPYLIHVPTLTGGTGYQKVRRFYKYHFIPGWSLDVEVTRISHSRAESGGRRADRQLHSRSRDGRRPAGHQAYRPVGGVTSRSDRGLGKREGGL